MADCIPFWDDADEITCHANVALTGQRFATIVGPTVEGNPLIGLPVAGGDTFVVVGRDVAAGDKVIGYGANLVVPVETAAAIAAGEEVEVNALGQVIPLAAGKARGKALDDAANGSTAMIRIYP